MNKWIILHLKYDGREVIVNTDNVTNINISCDKSDAGFVVVCFNGDYDNAILVNESYETVKRMLMGAQNED